MDHLNGNLGTAERRTGKMEFSLGKRGKERLRHKQKIWTGHWLTRPNVRKSLKGGHKGKGQWLIIFITDWIPELQETQVWWYIDLNPITWAVEVGVVGGHSHKSNTCQGYGVGSRQGWTT